MTNEEFQNRVLSLPDPEYFELYEEFEPRPSAGSGPTYREAFPELLKIATPEQRNILRDMIRSRLSGCRLTPEERISRALRRAIEPLNDGADFLNTLELRRICYQLEYYLPSVLAEVYPHWKNESLDGIFFSEARRVNSEWAEFFGMCILISDQTVTPIYLRLKVVPLKDKIDAMECRIGQRGTSKGDMERVPFEQWRINPLATLANSMELVDWVYQINLPNHKICSPR